MTYRTGLLDFDFAGGGSGGGPVDWADVTGKPSTFAPSAHTHAIADVTDLQTALDGLADKWTWLKLANNSTVSTVAFANVSGMSFTALANTTYLVDVIGAYQAAATTTGIALALDIPSGSVVGQNIVNTNATTLGGAEQIADATTTGATTGVRAANTNTPITARFVVRTNGTGGTVQLMQRSEVASSNTVLQAGLTIMGYRAI
jgi:hypothetical protein